MKTSEELRKYKLGWARKKNGVTKESLSRSTTWKGRRAEILAQTILLGASDNNRKRLNQPYDLLWNGLKIDVKSCNLYHPKTKPNGWWVFNKNKGESDYYFCIGMNKNIPEKYWLIPSSVFKNGISIGEKSKFNKYQIYGKENIPHSLSV